MQTLTSPAPTATENNDGMRFLRLQEPEATAYLSKLIGSPVLTLREAWTIWTSGEDVRIFTVLDGRPTWFRGRCVSKNIPEGKATLRAEDGAELTINGRNVVHLVAGGHLHLVGDRQAKRHAAAKARSEFL